MIRAPSANLQGSATVWVRKAESLRHENRRNAGPAIARGALRAGEAGDVLPGPEVPTHVLHDPLDRSLSFGERIRVASVAKPLAWA